MHRRDGLGNPSYFKMSLDFPREILLALHKMKSLSLSPIAAILCLVLGGFLGATLASKRAAEDAYTSALFWHIAMERDLQSRNLDRADELSLTGTEATLLVLNQLENENPISSGWTILTQEGPMANRDNLLASARDILKPRLEELSEESRDFLVDLPDP